ncbi:hypothetical protein UFOVP116_357 [uncultured Caudovirales phage]|uniref:Uncharacterized protein n=1 Tax=uncultured Caudovirales phage TaxID=2100421 RepID=A0A6J5L8D4_9CAUD|nr:hypothetical protein UFOVP116_357 [uncultured Caudovirales phage]
MPNNRDQEEPQREVRGDTTLWHINETLHRIGGPALECENGFRSWFKDGQHHRIDGPAVEFPSGSKQWYVDGVRFDNIHEYCDAAGIVGLDKTIFLLKWVE